MAALLITLVLVSLGRVKYSSFHSDYMGNEQTTAIKGIFAVIILLSHMNGYVSWSASLDLLGCKVIAMIGQLMVTMFFFYSGYGILESWRKKTDYVSGFFRYRFLKVLVHFVLAVCLFAIMNVILGISYPAEDYLLCWVGWSSIGNSNWFIFDTLVFYLLSLAAMLFCKKAKLGEKTLCIMITVLCVLFWLALKFIKGQQGSWWYNTIFCFPAGVWYSCVKTKVDAFARKTAFWWLGLAGLTAVFVSLYLYNDVLAYTLCAAVFCILVVWITMKVKFCNKILVFLGANSFSIYILQRIPMIVFQHLGLNGNPYIFAACIVLAVFPLSAGFTWLLNLLDGRIFRKK